MANQQRYTAFQRTFSRAKEASAWFVAESIPGEFTEPAATDLCLVVSDISSNQEYEQHEDEQRRAGSRSKRDSIQGRLNHGTADVEMYERPVGDTGVWADVAANRPQGHVLRKGVFGGARLVNTHTLDTISAVHTATRDKTVMGVTSSAVYAVGDGIRLKSLNTAKSGPANGELRFITALNEGGANRITVEPGFSRKPVAASDQVQGGWTYYLTDDFTQTFSGLLQDGHLMQQCVGMAIEQLSTTIDGVNPLKMTFSTGYRGRVLAAKDQVKGDATTDAFLSTDTVLRVGDTTKYEVGARVNLRKITNATDAIAGTEVKAIITAIDHAAGTLTLTRGSSPVAATDLQAISTAINKDISGGITVPAGGFIDLSIDRRPRVRVLLTAGAGKVAADIHADIDAFLTANEHYGYHVGDRVRGRAAISYEDVASSPATSVVLTSQVWGSESQIVVYFDSGLSSDMADDVFTLVGGITTTITATDEIQVIPWTPGATEVDGAPLHNKVGWLFWDGYKVPITSMELTLNNNVIWIEDQKTDADDADGFVAGDTRTVEVTLSGKFRGEVPRLFYAAKNDVLGKAVIQVGKTEGSTTGYFLRNFKVSNPQLSGDDVREYSITMRVFATALLEDELFHAVA